MASNNISIALTADDRTSTAFASVKRSLGGLESAGRFASAALASIGVGISVGGIVAFAKTAIDAADNMRDLAIATGTSVKSLASYELAAKQSGTNIEALAQGMGKLSLFMAKNADEAQKLGISAKDPAVAFAQLADALEKAATPADRNAIAAKVLGKSYAELMPLLAQGGAELRSQAAASAQYAEKIGALADKADVFNDQLEKLKQHSTSAGISMANVLLPALNAIAEGFDNAASSQMSFMQGASLGVNIWNNTGQQIKDLRNEINDLESQQETAVSLGFGRYKSIDNRIKQAKEFKKQLEEIQRNEALALLDGIQKKGSQPTPRASVTFGSIDNKGSKKKPELDELMPEHFKQWAEAEKKAAKEAEDWRLAELAHYLDAYNATMQQYGEKITGAFELDKDVADGLKDVADEAFGGDAYARKFSEIETRLKGFQERWEAVRTGMSSAGADNMLSAINTWSEASYKQAEVAGAQEELATAEESRQRRFAVLSAEVTAGIKTQDAARRESIQISRDTLDAMKPHLGILQALAENGYPPAIEAAAKYKAQLIELQDAARDKTWLDGINAGLKDYAGTTIDTFKTASDAVKSGFKSMEDALTGFVMTGKLDFNSLANSIIADMVRMQVQASITKPLASAFSSIFASSGTTAPISNATVIPVASAKGNIFSNAPGLSAYSGQIVSRPTVFPFASGIGLMGEAGPEAIMPLKRGADGRLGVAGGGANVQVNVINNAGGSQASAQERSDGNGGRIIDVLIEQVKGAIAGDISRGSGPVPSALASTYGLNRVAGAY